jgi:riboflavin synthase
MVTGLIEAVGRVIDVHRAETQARVVVETPLASALAPGDSISINGVCLTVTSSTPSSAFDVEIGPETSRVTTLGALEVGTPVNLERAMRADGRFGGHMVLGHVDGTGTIEHLRAEESFWWMTVSFPRSFAPYLIRRGSVAVDGISLTVAALGGSHFDVQIIPFTWRSTNLKVLKAGDRVNIEYDVLGKYVARAMECAS